VSVTIWQLARTKGCGDRENELPQSQQVLLRSGSYSSRRRRRMRRAAPMALAKSRNALVAPRCAVSERNDVYLIATIPHFIDGEPVHLQEHLNHGLPHRWG
jgi:hypothetical protein